MSIPYISSIGCIVQPAVYIYSIASMSGFCVQNEKSSVLIFTIFGSVGSK